MEIAYYETDIYHSHGDLNQLIATGPNNAHQISLVGILRHYIKLGNNEKYHGKQL